MGNDQKSSLVNLFVIVILNCARKQVMLQAKNLINDDYALQKSN